MDGRLNGVGIVATYTISKPLLSALEFWHSTLELDGSVVPAAYNQVLQELAAPCALRQTAANVIIIHFPDLCGLWHEGEAHSLDAIGAHVDILLGSIRLFARDCRPLVVCLCPWERSAFSCEVCTFLEEQQRRLLGLADDCSSIQTIHLQDELPVDGFEVFDEVGYRIGHCPFTETVDCAVATCVYRALRRALAPSLKAIAVDCDDTLWSGAVGELGARGVGFRPYHLALQQRLAKLSQVGVLICLCSRNSEADVREVFDVRRDEMSLLWSQLAGWHIMHSCKVDGLRGLAAQLRLSVTDFCFVDDNPAECTAVMAAEPATHVLHMNPNDEDSLSGVVRRSWLLDVPSKEVTSEDLRRARMHHEQRERNSFLASEAGESSASKLLHTLMVELSFLSDGALDCGRIAQLSERTNQFNSSGRTIILTPGDVDRYRADGGSCIAVQVAR